MMALSMVVYLNAVVIPETLHSVHEHSLILLADVAENE